LVGCVKIQMSEPFLRLIHSGTMWGRLNNRHLRFCFRSLGVVSSVPHLLEIQIPAKHLHSAQ
jgi:hypothetical protein